MPATEPGRRTLAVIAPVHPQVSGAGQFNTSMVAALEDLGPVLTLSWRRLYPPLLHRRAAEDRRSRPLRLVAAEPLLDYVDPRSWRRAVERVSASGAAAVILPWVHPVMAPPYRAMLRELPPGVARVVICHNVAPHEPVPLGATLTRAALRHADLLVVHATHEAAALRRLGLGDKPVLEAFHPRFPAEELCAIPSAEAVAVERARQGHPALSLLAFGAIRPYKGIDLALEALARIPAERRVRLTVAGVFWDGGADLRRRTRELGLEDRVELRDGFVSNEEAALLFAAADASILPYRSATQSGVVQLSFAHGVPVIATAVGGIPEAVREGVDGLLCPAGDSAALAAAIERMAHDRALLAAGVSRSAEQSSFGRYAELIHDQLERLPERAPRARRAGRPAVARGAF